MLNKFLALAFLILSPLVASAHDGGLERISLQVENPAPLKAAEKIPFSFQIFDKDSKKAVTEADLKLSHTKKIHLIVYDASLKEFNHVHPEYVDGFWKAELNLTVNGSYFVWAQGLLTDSVDFSALYKVNVEGGKTAWPVIQLGDQRKGSTQNTTVELSKEKIKAGRMVGLTYTVTREDDTTPVITPYLGANAHVIAVSPDGENLIHVHPMDSPDANVGLIHASFPKEGDYRIWVQLVDHDELKTIPLSVTVVK